MKKELLEKLINKTLIKKPDFSDIFYEEKVIKKYCLVDSKIDKIITNIFNGIGFRISKGETILYDSTNKLDEDSLNLAIDNLNDLLDGDVVNSNIKLEEIKIENNKKIISHSDFSDIKKKEYLYNIDKIARSYSDNIIQVEATLYENDQNIEIANSLGKYVKDTRFLTRLYVSVVAKKGDVTANSYKTFGTSGGYEFFDTLNIDDEVFKLAQSACNKLDAVSCPGGEMPVIIGPGFGGVIIHEACGHALEATSVAKNLSVLSNKKGKKVANNKVTIIDDGTVDSLWGSLNIDDEGNKPQKNILIENGILKSYLVDYLNSKKMNDKITGSGRRESYLYTPTSRMNNTYVLTGNDKIEDMIKSIDYGLYAVQMGGGSVDPITGDFNFSVLEAYLIRNGKIAEMVKGASLIGNTLDILEKIEMVSDDLSIETGWCGSESGQVAVGCGQPTIKVSSILVGGDNND